MLKRVLVANRGEIALRIIRECLDKNIETVAIYSSADKDSLHVLLANESVCVGAAPPSESYLKMDNIIEAALGTGCDAVHPGFGFLSENPAFAALCEENGIKFIGPSSNVIEQMGNKSAARELMMKAKVPTVPGSDGAVSDIETAKSIAEKIGFPILIKASAGGGGRGMRRANSLEDIERAFDEARAEARAAFGDDTVYIEKLILNPKHIEVQVLSDSYGKTIHLGERNCSIQRKNQKMLEEAPAFAFDQGLRDRMCEAAVKAAEACNYEGAGTVEFVLDSENNFYFIEMNTRIQVEHPVTEMVTGVNIVAQQIRIASGLPLDIDQSDVKIKGHAIECRICAENPIRDFAASPGHVNMVHFPGGNGVRVESALYSGCDISPYYDSMAAKIIVYGDTRVEAVRRMRRALEETIIEGIDTTLLLQYLILFNRVFLRGNYNTSFIEKEQESLLELLRTATDIRGK
ncbi:MAG: acetyl-CoA carboxylase biotin carboxylase subunit [[Eubacterium] sulci]|nr:acetyl-CoA carboxylase biotin carboxylase subunit [[Eubacterium] sulci]